MPGWRKGECNLSYVDGKFTHCHDVSMPPIPVSAVRESCTLTNVGTADTAVARYFHGTFASSGTDHVVRNVWEGSHINFVIFLARNGNWGVIAPAFPEREQKLHHKEHRKFDRTRKVFLKQFHQM